MCVSKTCCRFIKLPFGSIVCSTNFSIFISNRIENFSSYNWGQKNSEQKLQQWANRKEKFE